MSPSKVLKRNLRKEILAPLLASGELLKDLANHPDYPTQLSFEDPDHPDLAAALKERSGDIASGNELTAGQDEPSLQQADGGHPGKGADPADEGNDPEPVTV